MANTYKDNNLIHIPVTITPEDKNYIYNGKECSWWTSNPLFKWDAMLISAAHGMSEGGYWQENPEWKENPDKVKRLQHMPGRGGVSTRHEFDIRDDVLFFGDSGGFQVLQAYLGNIDKKITERLTPEAVLNWQMDVCDIGMTLDMPTPRTWNDLHNESIYEICLNTSKKNALKMYDMHQKAKEIGHGENFKLFNCVHGINLRDMLRWYDETTDHHNIEYDGFSLATSVDMKYLLALRLGFAMTYSKNKPFHLLGVSSPLALTLITYANKYTDTQIYFDSSSASTGRMIRKYMIFWDFSSNGITMNEEHKRYEKMHTLACPCPICSQLNNPSDLWKLKTTSGILITLHNLFWMSNYTAFLQNLVHCPEEYEAYARRLTNEPMDSPYGRTSWLDAEGNPLSIDVITDLQRKGEKCISAPIAGSWVLNYMRFIDLVNEKGLDYAYSQFIEPTESIDHWIDDTTNKEEREAKELLNMETNSGIVAPFKAAEKIAKEKVEKKIKEDKVLAEVVDELIAIATPAKKGRKVADDIPIIVNTPSVQDIDIWW